MVARVLIITALLLTGAATSSLAAATGQLSPDEIKAMFGNGKPFTAVSTSGKPYWLTLNADGSAQERPKEKKTGKSGTWRLFDKGYCSKWGVHTEKCYTVQRDGKQFAVRDSGGHLISNWVQ